MISANDFQDLVQKLAEDGAALIAVSKLKPASDIERLYSLGQRDFGENYVQELLEKQPLLPPDIRWHFIGHLQSNKVKYIAPFVYMIHGVDSLRLLREIDKQAQKHNRVIPCLLQIHVATEETKFGLDEKEALELMEYYTAAAGELQHVSIAGLMGMASFTADRDKIASEFRSLKALFSLIRQTYFLADDRFCVLSMGMSGDYEIAVAEGSTHVRIGSLLFGNRK